jgi:6-pyruvoyltetrahydropterin/6-carboxytetrahydropterin synthase
MKKIQYISRKGNFDSGHRVMNERMKCFNVHGHTYLYELTFSFENMEEIGYAIDFKEIKRVFCQWIDDILDHGMILNPHDASLIQTTRDLGSKLWLMSLNGSGNYCNPSVENIAKEVFLAMEILADTLYKGTPTGLKIHKVVIYETPNCWTECTLDSISDNESRSFYIERLKEISEYAKSKGIVEYDDRKYQLNKL